MQVRPEDRAVHALGHLAQVVVVIPIDAEVHEAQHVAHEYGKERAQVGEVGPVRHAQLEDHDRDDDGEHAIAERFEPSLPHHSLRRSLSAVTMRSEEHTSELQSLTNLVCRLLLEKKKRQNTLIQPDDSVSCRMLYA